MTPSDTPILIALRVSPAQPRPFAVTALRQPSVVAAEALTEAEKLLARSGARLALRVEVAAPVPEPDAGG